MKRLLSVVLAAALLVTITPLSGVAGNVGPSRSLLPRSVPTKPKQTTISAFEKSGFVHLKFREGTLVRLRGQRFVSLGGDDLDAVNAVLKSQPGGVRLSRLFDARTEPDQAAEKRRLEVSSGREQADKNLYYRVRLAKNAEAAALIDALNALPIVEIAYPEPLPAPPPTADFTASQGYAFTPPNGIGIDYARTVPGGRGGTSRSSTSSTHGTATTKTSRKRESPERSSRTRRLPIPGATTITERRCSAS